MRFPSRVSDLGFRHAQAGRNTLQTVQELIDHPNVETTMIYTDVLSKGGRGVKSPLDE